MIVARHEVPGTAHPKRAVPESFRGSRLIQKTGARLYKGQENKYSSNDTCRRPRAAGISLATANSADENIVCVHRRDQIAVFPGICVLYLYIDATLFLKAPVAAAESECGNRDVRQLDHRTRFHLVRTFDLAPPSGRVALGGRFPGLKPWAEFCSRCGA